jgi:hypothetical protein
MISRVRFSLQQQVSLGKICLFLNEKENFPSSGELFQDLADESARITYAQRLWDFFRGLFEVATSKIFDLFKIEERCSSYIKAFTQVLCFSMPIKECET